MTVVQAWETVWGFRGRFNQWFATPNTLWSLRFAFTEAGEALDAWIRAYQDQVYTRSEEKSLNFLGELADTMIMLLSARDRVPDVDEEDAGLTPDIDLLCEEVGRALAGFKLDPRLNQWNMYVDIALGRIAAWPGFTLEILDSRLQRIFVRRIRPKMAHEGVYAPSYWRSPIGSQSWTMKDYRDTEDGDGLP